jgi:hypothetical protein
MGERFERSTEAAAGFFGGASHAADFSFVSREQGHKQIGFAKRVSTQDDRFGFLEHGGAEVIVEEPSAISHQPSAIR